MTIRRSSCTHALLVLAGCLAGTDSAPGSTTREPAILLHYDDTSRVTLPAGAAPNDSFTVEFTSFGGGCVTQGDTEVRMDGLVTELRPYRRQYHPRPGEGCTKELRIFQHTVTLQFSSAGTGVIRIVGVRHPDEQAFTLERTVPVDGSVLDATVRFANIEGGCWILEAGSGARYQPVTLAQEFRRDGLAVRAAIKPRPDMASICQIGSIVEILWIRER